MRKFIPAGLDPTAQRIDDNDQQENWTRIVGVTGNVRQDIYEPPLAERDWLMDEMDPVKCARAESQRDVAGGADRRRSEADYSRRRVDRFTISTPPCRSMSPRP